MAPGAGEQLLLSVVEHYAYCPRQAAPIHVDAEWVPNSLTAQGTADHAAVDAATRQVSKDGVESWHSLPVWSDELGIYGVCDVVEFSPVGPVPVEYKPSLSRSTQAPAAQQVAAQAMGLEETFDVVIDAGFKQGSGPSPEGPRIATRRRRADTVRSKLGVAAGSAWRCGVEGIFSPGLPRVGVKRCEVVREGLVGAVRVQAQPYLQRGPAPVLISRLRVQEAPQPLQSVRREDLGYRRPVIVTGRS